MKVLHLGKYFPPFFGGIESFMAQLMRQQQRQGMDVSAIVHQQVKDFTAKTATWHGCKVHYVKSYGQLIYAPVAPAFGVRLLRLLRSDRPDIVHVHMPNLSAFWLLFLAPFTYKSRWIVHWHADVIGSVPDKKVKLLYPLYRIFERWLLSKACKVICTSLNYLDSSEALKPYRQICEVVPLGIKDEVQTVAHAKQAVAKEQIQNSCTDRPLRLICIGRLTYYKGHCYLLDALKQLRLQGIPVQLDIVGSGELEQMLKQQAEHYQLSEQVTFHGSVSEQRKQQLLTGADLLCLPSIERTEAFGVVILEAAALAIPALVTDVPGSGMSYVVEDNKTGLLVKAGNTQSLVDKLIWASLSKSALAVMGKQARLRQQHRFSIESVAKQISSLYLHGK
ncbi:glycosyltransferase family 4 protein [Bowmanella denitrificans]|uniref:Glycosyltransferase family 4 protein n=1 Tax=Bowmanella denitrificans TaxID=366582 RepID=A0ABN0X3K9_9ALTE